MPPPDAPPAPAVGDRAAQWRWPVVLVLAVPVAPDLPDLPRFGDVAPLLGGTTRARVWWAAPNL